MSKINTASIASSSPHHRQQTTASNKPSNHPADLSTRFPSWASPAHATKSPKPLNASSNAPMPPVHPASAWVSASQNPHTSQKSAPTLTVPSFAPHWSPPCAMAAPKQSAKSPDTSSAGQDSTSHHPPLGHAS